MESLYLFWEIASDIAIVLAAIVLMVAIVRD